ncbi:MAG: hypothetical protein ACRC9L_00710 [Brevinema sp.]
MSKLEFLNGWGKVANYFTRRSAQSFMGSNQLAFAAARCGASDEKPTSACGSACRAGDSDVKPSSCGSTE